MQLKNESDNYLQINRSDEELHTGLLWDGVTGEPSRVWGEACMMGVQVGCAGGSWGRQTALGRLQVPLPSCSLAPSLPHSAFIGALAQERGERTGWGEWAPGYS